MNNFATQPRMWFVLCVALLSSQHVVGQWTGLFNTTNVATGDPLEECRIKSLNGVDTALKRCTCTGGKVSPDCNWREDKSLFNRVSDATCICKWKRVDPFEWPEPLAEFTKKQPQGVRGCVCDPPSTEPEGDNPLTPSGPDCWCLASSLAKKSGLSDAAEDQASSIQSQSQASPVQSQSQSQTATTGLESCSVDWIVFPDDRDCVCTNGDEAETCPPSPSGKQMTAIRSADCRCGDDKPNADDRDGFPLTGCVCTVQSRGGKRDRCICRASS
ncbi:hypothetical protein XA68_14722 [Ophiocordyceps unilateralis]|uniref:Uncharacterized protein n=1 Tax=Ophiocordyceps unilateralis TaxID=268505 RepID=A0A2A9PMA3_OPHUN|nr:hypothetical protein XA68_14722 [Ophiocordyceps unilateralis]